MAKKRRQGTGIPGDFEPHSVLIRPHLDGFERAVFATTTVVNHTPREFCLTFLQVLQPVGPPDELRKLRHIEGHCVARVVITPDHMEKLVKAMQDNLDKYHRTTSKYLAEEAKESKGEES